MPPFQFDDFQQHGLSTGRSATPLHGERPVEAQVVPAGSLLGSALSAAVNPRALEPGACVYAALLHSGELLAYLSQSGLQVVPLTSPSEAISRCAEMQGQVLLLDWDYPGFDPHHVCRAMRLDRRDFPVIVLSEKNDVFDEVLAFELGVSDFVVKPVQPRILLARIKSCIKRTAGRVQMEMHSHLLAFGRLTIDLTSRVVQVGHVNVELSSAEFDLLAYLAARAGHVVRRNEIEKALCKEGVRAQTRSIDSRMYRLRKRLAPLCDAQMKIKSIRPHGYLFCNEPW